MKITCGFVNISRFSCVFKRLVLGFFPGLFLCVALNAGAQEEGAMVYYLEGASFALTVGNERSVFPDEMVRGKGVSLERTGIVHTGAGAFLEIQLIPSGTVIKLSENTSLVYNGVDETGGFVDLGLLYGRIRVVSGDGMGAAPVVIRSGGISSRLEKGDMGTDYILEPGDRNSIPRPLFRIHVFAGNAEVFPYGRAGPQPYFGGTQTLSAENGESLSLDISSSYTFAEKTPLSEEAAYYWNYYKFAGSSPLPMPSTAIAMAPEETVYVAPAPTPPPPPSMGNSIIVPYIPDTANQPLPSITSNRTKNIVLAIGLALTLSAAAAQGVTYFKYDINSNRTANTIFTASQVPLGVGIIATLGGLLYNPSPGRK